MPYAVIDVLLQMFGQVTVVMFVEVGILQKITEHVADFARNFTAIRG